GFLDFHVGAGGDGVAGQDFLAFATNDDLRVQILLVFDDHGAHDTGRLVHFLADGDTGNHVAELDAARFFGDDGNVIRIPLDEGFALLGRGAVGHRDDRADDDVVAFQLATVLGVQADRAVLVEHHVIVVRAFHNLEVV